MEIKNKSKAHYLYCEYNKRYSKEKVEKEDEDGVSVNLPINKVNVVSGDKLREIQSITLANTKDFLSKTFGPMGSNTKIIKGTNQAEITSSYSKDGLKVLSNIINSGPIEASIVDELISITRSVEKEVGDGTTSTVILSSLIFDRLREIEKRYNIPPFQLCKIFQSVVEDIKASILECGRPCTVDDIYNISMISTNGNQEVAENIKSIYEEYGMDVDLSVGISNTSDSVIRSYDGMTITEGMADPAFINNKKDNTVEIHDAHIYHFDDPIDTMDMVALFEAILQHNIYEPIANDEDPIPTVITCPRVSSDMAPTMKMLVNQLYQYDAQNASAAKPPILLVTNVVASDEIIMDDIANLCGCKIIKKYIDPEIYKRDVEAGVAPTVDTIQDFCGTAELVVSDSKKTKFINPKHMCFVDDEGNMDPEYANLIKFLETEIEVGKESENAHEIGLLKKRLSALRANMVDYLVGGVTIAERDMKKDLVEDAIKNCKSASMYGVGYAANFEGLKNSYKITQDYVKDKYPLAEDNPKINLIYNDIAQCIFASYCDAAKILYGTVELDKNIVEEAVFISMENGKPYDISSGELDIKSDNGDSVLCSIKLDVNILDTLSKIITMMATSNQCLLQASHLNIY